MKPSDVTAVVLMGGTSSRMWPLGDKHLLPFAGHLLLDIHLHHLRRVGIEHFVLTANERNEHMIRDHTASLSAEVVVDDATAGMAGAILRAMSRLTEDAMGRALYITQPHDVVDATLHEQVLRRGAEGSGDAYLAGYITEQYFPGGYLVLEGDRIAGIVERPAPGAQPSNMVTIVAHLFNQARTLLPELERGVRARDGDDIYEQALSAMMAGMAFKPVEYSGSWQALKYPWHVLDVMARLLDRIGTGALDLGDRYEQVEPGVFLGKDVKLFPGSHLVAPVVLGHGVVVGHNALVRGSMIGDRCVIGYGSEVARSYLGEGCELHANYVGDSVLEREVLLGYGTTSANYRLDGRPVKSSVGCERIGSGRTKLGMIIGGGAKVGVNVSVMPGIKIGAGAIVGPGQTVMKDVDDHQRLLANRSRRTT